MSVFDPVDALFDRLVVADVQDGQGESFPIRITSSFHQLVFSLQVTHCCYDCKWMPVTREEKDLLSCPHYVDDTVINTARKKSSSFLMFACQCFFFVSYF